MRKKIFILMSFIFMTGCAAGADSSNNSAAPTAAAIPVGALMNEYAQSKEATKAKYTGKTLTVRGYTLTSPNLPTGADDAGILSIMEKGGDLMKMLTCQFSAADKEEFSKIKGDQMVTITGVFNDDLSTSLQSCKVVKIE